MIYSIGKFLCQMFILLFGHPRVIGREHVPATGGVILTANHTSYLDPPLVGACIRRPSWFMGKSELFTIPILGPLLHHVRAFPVKRGTADRQALRRAHQILTDGEALTLFFEGGRSNDGRLLPPELGIAMIALRANVPIVPVAIINADHLLPREGGIHFAHVTIIYGEPLFFPQLAGKQSDRTALRKVSTTVARHVADLLRENGAADRVPEGYLADNAE